MSALSIKGGEASADIREYAAAVLNIFDSAAKNRIETKVVLQAIHGLSAAASQSVVVRGCTFNSAGGA